MASWGACRLRVMLVPGGFKLGACALPYQVPPAPGRWSGDASTRDSRSDLLSKAYQGWPCSLSQV